MGVSAWSDGFHEKYTEGKGEVSPSGSTANLAASVFHRVDLPDGFASLACACLAERSEATCIKTSTRQDLKITFSLLPLRRECYFRSFCAALINSVTQIVIYHKTSVKNLHFLLDTGAANE